MTADDPHDLGPWARCARCGRRYRPASYFRHCYDCRHGIDREEAA